MMGSVAAIFFILLRAVANSVYIKVAKSFCLFVVSCRVLASAEARTALAILFTRNPK